MNTYREPSYEKRVVTNYRRGEFVRIGPRYVMGGNYEHDSDTGKVYTVVGRLPGGTGNDYKLVEGIVSHEDDLHGWDLIVSASRLEAWAGKKVCVCGKEVGEKHRPVAAYGSWCCPDRI